MIGRIGRRVLDGGVVLFALYAFVFVPLGKKTGFEHARAIFTTPAAREAGRDLWRATERLKHALFDSHTDPKAPAGPAQAASAHRLEAAAPAAGPRDAGADVSVAQGS